MGRGTWTFVGAGFSRPLFRLLAAAAVAMMCLVGAQAEPRTEAPTLRGRLQPRGQTLVYPDGTRFLWRGVTAFQLVDHVADGREDRARVFLSWARATGFSVVRVLAMASGLFELAPADGLRALPRLLALAAEYDLYVEVVALSDTRAYPALDLPAHVRAVGAACDRAPNSLLEVANEPYHPTYVRGLTAARLAALASGVPARVPVALGAASSDTARDMATPPADYVTAHRERSARPWPMLGRMRDLAGLSSATGLYVVDDEPDGFGEREQVTRVDGRRYRRQVRAELAFAQGAMSRVFDVGSTWHCESCLTADVPGPVQQAAANAFIAGTRIVPDEARLLSRDVGGPGSPVARCRAAGSEPRDGAAVGVYPALASATSGVVVLLGVRGDPGIVWARGWREGAVVAEWPECRVIRVDSAQPAR